MSPSAADGSPVGAAPRAAAILAAAATGPGEGAFAGGTHPEEGENEEGKHAAPRGNGADYRYQYHKTIHRPGIMYKPVIHV